MVCLSLLYWEGKAALGVGLIWLAGDVEKGCIINISSVLGIKAGVGSVAYAASKAGVIGSLLSPSPSCSTPANHAKTRVNKVVSS